MTSRVVIQLIDRSQTDGVVWCDGRRSADLRDGLQIEVQQGRHRLLLARPSEAPFTDRLVNKFGLRVEGWRGEADERVHHEDRAISLGPATTPTTPTPTTPAPTTGCASGA